MAKVRGKDTKPEMRVRAALHSSGLRYRLHAKELPGKPDIVFRSRRIAIFVHGCFWHRHKDCAHTRTPKTRVEFWEGKFAQNEARDRAVATRLNEIGWTVITVWECETANGERLKRVLDQIASTPIQR
jgi:DNA mismatch endonuclease (patch repair protein)